ncbi:MAG: ABC transporter ATP-binding protein [Coriobacteriia bacterium]|nr:ABC transporter ATP-binding protein [Coriobacteriia bacterium]MCL2537661.1 ABC transporter ATP-binding protein [Coriobacteriia bacterium]
MLRATNLSKHFDGTAALHDLNCSIPEGVVYGLVGSNGAGKSTLLRLAAGIFAPGTGQMTLDDAAIFENTAAKERIILVPDELYFLSQSSLNRMAQLYARCFPHFSRPRYEALVKLFQLDPNKAIRTFSKGMKRQSAILLALACEPRYLLLDEAFDGLDPLMRDVVRKIIARDVSERGTTIVISSHSLRELEDTCDNFALLHKGSLLFENPKADLLQQAPDGLEALFVQKLEAAGYRFDDALEEVYAA